LDVAVGRVGGHKRKYAAMMLQWSSRAGVQVSMLSLLLGGLILSLGAGVLSLDFRGLDPMGRISARRGKRQFLKFEVQRSQKKLKVERFLKYVGL